MYKLAGALAAGQRPPLSACICTGVCLPTFCHLCHCDKENVRGAGWHILCLHAADEDKQVV